MTNVVEARLEEKEVIEKIKNFGVRFQKLDRGRFYKTSFRLYVVILKHHIAPEVFEVEKKTLEQIAKRFDCSKAWVDFKKQKVRRVLKKYLESDAANPQVCISSLGVRIKSK